jgi:hypothetical protein
VKVRITTDVYVEDDYTLEEIERVVRSVIDAKRDFGWSIIDPATNLPIAPSQYPRRETRPENPQPVDRSVDKRDPYYGYLFRPDGDRWPKDDQGEHAWVGMDQIPHNVFSVEVGIPVEDDPTIEQP